MQVFGFFLTSNFHLVLNFVCFLLGNSPASEVLYPDVSKHSCLFHLHWQVGVKNTHLPMKMEKTVCSETSEYKNSDAGELPRRKHTKIGFL